MVNSGDTVDIPHSGLAVIYSANKIEINSLFNGKGGAGGTGGNYSQPRVCSGEGDRGILIDNFLQ